MHPQRGIYMGGCAGGGIAWWSVTHPPEGDEVPTFPSEASARAWFAPDADEPWHAALEFRPVDTRDGKPGIDALSKAGLADLLGVLGHSGWSRPSGVC